MNYEQHSSAIQAVIADYFRGIHEGDIERLCRVFHPQAQLFGEIKGQPYHRTLPDYLEAVRARKSPAALGEPFRMRILSIECINGIASARLHCPMLGFNYYDFLALNFIGGRWQVVSKLFTHADPARSPFSVGWTERHDVRVPARPGTSVPESTEAELLARVARGDIDAFGALYDLLAAAINQPLSTVKARIRRGMLQLRESLEVLLGKARLRTGVHQSLFFHTVAEGEQRAASSRQSIVRIILILLSLVAVEAQAQPVAPPTDVNSVRCQTTKVDAVEIFYREAGPTNGPVVLLLHGFPASSFMYRDLMPKLGGRFRVIAPDYPGFGYSSAPTTNEFDYTFDRLAEVMDKFSGKLGLTSYAIYMQDFGGPVGFRLALRHPERVSALVVQNANAYAEGLPDSFWALAKTLWKEPSSANFTKLRDAAMSDAALEWNYTHGVADPARISPDSWVLQRALLERKGNKDAMMELLYDYRRNLDQYPKWHDYFRKHQPPTLIVWGKNDIIFPPSGAHPYLRDLPKAELHLLDTGHFALEDKHAEIAALMGDFLGRKLRR